MKAYARRSARFVAYFGIVCALMSIAFTIVGIQELVGFPFVILLMNCFFGDLSTKTKDRTDWAF
jgi:hypothetical protein